MFHRSSLLKSDNLEQVKEAKVNGKECLEHWDAGAQACDV